MRIVGLILFISLFSGYRCSYQERIHISSNGIHIRYEHQLTDKTSDFTQIVDWKLFDGVKSTNCSPSNAEFCINWDDLGEFRISKINDHCEKYRYWTKLDRPISVAFDISGLHLYGAEEINNQTWPIVTGERPSKAFVSNKENSESVLEPIWYTSTGFYLFVDQNIPLFVRFVGNSFRISAQKRGPYIRGSVTHLNYKVCKYENVKTASIRAIEDTLGKPSGVPDYKMTAWPIWSTWAKYKRDVNESAVRQYADSIAAHNFPGSQIEIDDKWETCYGSLTVDTKRFPDMRRLVNRIHSQGYRVTVWVHPFVNYDCSPYFETGRKNGYFIRHSNGSVVGQWWNGAGAYIDFTNADAVDWYLMRLGKLQRETGIDSFKFDAGESNYVTETPFYRIMADDHPDTIVDGYVRAAATFGNFIEVRVGRGTQKYPIFVRMMDRASSWDGELGLKTLIPELLHMNMVGYPFVLPDMVGGNGYGKEIPTKEMFIRWLQCNVFMPSLQFSYLPWDFDDETLSISRKFVDLHIKYAPKIYKAMERTMITGSMVNGPIWLIDPTDPVALKTNSEFLVGDEILVAPVLENGARSRDIYLPQGIWRDEIAKDAPLITGPKWLRDYPAGLDVLPYFTRVTPSSSSILSPSSLVILITLLFYWWK